MTPNPNENQSLCPNCGKPGPHFIPPCLGDPGFFACEELNKSSNPNENQAEKHSAEPLRITDIPSTNRSKPYWIGSDTNLSMGAIYGYENATRLIACWNFCAGHSDNELAALETASKAIKNCGNRINTLTAELSTLRKELEADDLARDNTNLIRQVAASKDAKEWIKLHGRHAIGCPAGLCSLHAHELQYCKCGLAKLRELLNNRKDGK